MKTIKYILILSFLAIFAGCTSTPEHKCRFCDGGVPWGDTSNASYPNCAMWGNVETIDDTWIDEYRACPVQKAKWEKRREFEKKLKPFDNILIPVVNADHMLFSDFIKELEVLARKHDPDKRDISITYNAAKNSDFEFTMGSMENQSFTRILQFLIVLDQNELSVDGNKIVIQGLEREPVNMDFYKWGWPKGEESEKRLKAFKNVIIPEVEIDETPMPEFISLIEELARKHDPEKREISIVYSKNSIEPDGAISVELEKQTLIFYIIAIFGRKDNEIRADGNKIIIESPSD